MFSFWDQFEGNKVFEAAPPSTATAAPSRSATRIYGKFVGLRERIDRVPPPVGCTYVISTLPVRRMRKPRRQEEHEIYFSSESTGTANAQTSLGDTTLV